MHHCKIQFGERKIRANILSFQDLLVEVSKLGDLNNLKLSFLNEVGEWTELNSESEFEKFLQLNDKTRRIIEIGIERRSTNPLLSSSSSMSLQHPPSTANTSPNPCRRNERPDLILPPPQVNFDPLLYPKSSHSEEKNTEDDEEEEEEEIFSPIDDELDFIDSTIEEEKQDDMESERPKFVYDRVNYPYTGTWKSGVRHGTGIEYYSSNGERYEGEFKNDLKDGKGVYYFDDGERLEGTWKEDIRIGKVRCFRENGDVYEGEYREDGPFGYIHGNGTMNYSNGKRYEGEWKKDREDGRGTMTWPNGSKYEGEFKEGKICRFGDISFSNETEREQKENNKEDERPTNNTPEIIVISDDEEEEVEQQKIRESTPHQEQTSKEVIIISSDEEEEEEEDCERENRKTGKKRKRGVSENNELPNQKRRKHFKI